MSPSAACPAPSTPILPVAAGFFRTQRRVVVMLITSARMNPSRNRWMTPAAGLRADADPCARLVGAGSEKNVQVEAVCRRAGRTLTPDSSGRGLRGTSRRSSWLPARVSAGGGDDEHFGFFVGDGRYRTARWALPVAALFSIDVADVQHRLSVSR